ncbi:FAD-dependent 5-carboxymethylaminomethyl-2-thiouridine(34) oxidoreductase MnmC [Henriciella sp. AS95]|uniref:FAD-dependent 5-carboxymethylaminomethyl-2-thiouridine(34) oxidoreductase MnmC n=1 Tax=Henriciella sp. AS95 TaxID=3135782 RepID=UPI003174985F
MSRLPPRPDLSWKEDGTPVDERVGDVYFSRHNGLEEARTVFMQGCGLPERWAGRDTFTIAELGFGTGLNFLAVWERWRRTRAPGQWLHFVSFEGYLLDAGDAARALGAWPELEDLPGKLADAWPDRASGVQRMVWPDERLTLMLHVGEISQTLPESRFKADAWFLDGFSPAKNDAMWAESLWPLVHARSAEGAKLGTFTVAGAVRRGLAAAGFEVEKAPGFGFKRERLEVRFSGGDTRPADIYGLRGPAQRPRKVRVVGAGIAGASAARVLADRGLEVEVIDAAGPASAASGNPLALVMPRLDAGDTVQARLLIDAYLAARRFYSGRPGVIMTEVAHRPKDAREGERFEKLLADPPLGLENLEATSGGVLHKGAMILEPVKLIDSLLDGIKVETGRALSPDDLVDGVPTLLATGQAITEWLAWLKIAGRQGQVEFTTGSASTPPSAIASGHYALTHGTDRLWGATFEAWEGGVVTETEQARAQNMAALETLDPYWRQDARKQSIKSRAGIRATTPDRLPLIGAVPDFEAAREVFDGVRHGQVIEADAPLVPGLYLAGGFGSRGFTWGPWAGEILAAQLLSEPAPASVGALQAVSPMRQILRDLKRSG